jgi:hypothetical protein
MPGEILLLWDLLAAHRTLVVKPEARTPRIRLEFIPPGMTGQARLLDRQIMGSLKQGARQRFSEEIIRAGDAARTIEGPVEVRLNISNDVTQDEAIGASHRCRGPDVICH